MAKIRLVGSRSAVRSAEFHRKKQRQKRIKFGLLSLAFLAFLVLPFHILTHERQLISTITIGGNNVTEKEEIESVVQSHLAGAYLNFFPKSSAFLYPEEEIEQELLESIPRLTAVAVSLSGTQALEVLVSERTPAALYCENIESISSPTKCFFLDETAFIYSGAPNFSGVYSVYASEPTLENPIKTEFLSQETFLSIEKFQKDLTSLGLVPKVVVRSGDEYKAVLEDRTEVRWREDQNLERLAVDLASFLEEASFNKSELADLLYIDLRFDNKVFYKFASE